MSIKRIFSITVFSLLFIAIIYAILIFQNDIKYALGMMDKFPKDADNISPGLTSLFKGLDPKLTEGMTFVSFYSYNFRSWYGDESIGGYSPYFHSIEIQIINDENSYPYRVYHELGHSVWYNVLNQTERDIWKEIYSKSNYFVTDYAKTSYYEDFAETFAKYMTRGYDKETCYSNCGIDYNRLCVLNSFFRRINNETQDGNYKCDIGSYSCDSSVCYHKL